MRKVTIRLDEATARWVRECAAQRNTSVSRFICDLLAQRKCTSRRYEAAKQWFRERELWPLSQPGEIYPDREDLHGRTAGR